MHPVRTIAYHFTDQIGIDEDPVQVEYEGDTMYILIRSGMREHVIERELSIEVTRKVREGWVFCGSDDLRGVG